MPRDEVDPSNPRWVLADQLHEAIQRRWSAEILAVAVHGSMAHGDDTDSSDVALLVVTYRPGAGPRPVTRRVDGLMVELSVVDGETGLRRAGVLSPRWPLDADRQLTTRALHDPSGWLSTRRDTHLSRVAEARPAEFTGLAQRAWCVAFAAHARAVRLTEWYDTDPAMLLLGEARLHAALVIGLLGRTHYRNAADAVRRTGLAGADLHELHAVLAQQAQELTARGHPVDGTLRSLFG